MLGLVTEVSRFENMVTGWRSWSSTLFFVLLVSPSRYGREGILLVLLERTGVFGNKNRLEARECRFAISNVNGTARLITELI